jgi:SAM-dependent methyltransferase
VGPALAVGGDLEGPQAVSAADDTARNVELWTRSNAEHTDARAREAWARGEIDWGVWKVPESELRVLPPLEALDAVELGCGTAYFGAWLAQRGARVVGVDPTPAQLETARRMQRETGLEFPLVQAGGEEVPLPDASFDLALSEYGASIWADPYLWIPEAARLLRPGGLLVFLRNSTLVMLCSPDVGPATTELVRGYDEIGRIEWPEPEGGVEFHLSHGEWIDLLRANGFEVERLVELRAPEGAETHTYYDFVSADWARKWPAEEIWVARKRSG